jgi:toxin ParE1/3/4
MARYRLSQRADSDVGDIYLASALTFGLAQADRYKAGLEAVFEFLADNPRAARERSEVDPPVRVHPYGSHIVIYALDEVGVLVLRIRHGREDWTNDPL